MNYRKYYQDYHQICLLPGVDIHHIDGNRQNNSIENLQALFRHEHIQVHLDQGDWCAANLLSDIKIDVSGERNANYGNVWNEEQRKHLSEVRKKLHTEGKIKPWNKGKKMSDEIRQKNREGALKRKTKRPSNIYSVDGKIISNAKDWCKENSYNYIAFTQAAKKGSYHGMEVKILENNYRK